jgi:hypothetical protein
MRPVTMDDAYNTVIRDVQIKVGLSEAEHSSLHRQYLGRCQLAERFEPQAYCASLGISEISMERISSGQRVNVIAVTSANISILCSQWPAPWLMPTPFLGGDPNGPMMAALVEIQNVHITEFLDHLSHLFRRVQSRAPLPREEPTYIVPSIPLPRLELQALCHSISGQLVHQRPQGEQIGIDLRSNGFSAMWSSQYSSRMPDSPSTSNFPFFDSLPLQMRFTAALMHHPISLHLSKFANSALTESTNIFSIGAVDVSCNGQTLADIKDDTQNIPCLDLTSLSADIACFSNDIQLELWHHDVINAVAEISTYLPSSNAPADPSSSRLLDKLPEGLSIAVCIHKVTALILSPEMNVKDIASFSRGIAVRCHALSIDASSFRHSDAGEMVEGDLKNSERRDMLLLDEHHRSKVLQRVQQSAPDSTKSLHVDVSASDISVRSTVNTIDNPEVTLFQEAEFLNLIPVKFSLVSTGNRQSLHENVHANLNIPQILLTYQLEYIYSVLLAQQILRRIHSKRDTHSDTTQSGRRMPFNVTIKIDAVQIMCAFTEQRLALRVDNLRLDIGPDSIPLLRWRRLIARVPSIEANAWEELICFCRSSLHFPSDDVLSRIEIESARLQIPHRFVLANLIQEVNVSFKALKHLLFITRKGQFDPFPAPGPEPPKKVPNLQIRIAILCVQFADDPLEFKLNTIWNASQESTKVRAERERAFDAKVNAILTAHKSGKQGNEDEAGPNFTFSSQHSVSIQEARKRLDQVHLVDYRTRLHTLRQHNSSTEWNMNRHFRTATSIADIVDCAPESASTPLLRVVAENFELNLAKPSFSHQSLDSFMQEQGGLPAGTEYSLLIPVHVDWRFHSFRGSVRDYPIPLIDIPAVEDSINYAWHFQTDLVIAEEIGTSKSIEWIQCPVIPQSLVLEIPKTIMPVKTYANPDIQITSTKPSTIAWGVSYSAVMQDLMRIVETFSHAPRDSSPMLGFWDKVGDLGGSMNGKRCLPGVLLSVDALGFSLEFPSVIQRRCTFLHEGYATRAIWKLRIEI